MPTQEQHINSPRAIEAISFIYWSFEPYWLALVVACRSNIISGPKF